MVGEDRREELLSLLENAKEPVKGSYLAKVLNVSRQVIVQDIALLRAQKKEVLSTNKGYILQEKEEDLFQEVFLVKHNKEDVIKELFCIVDCGGKIQNVGVEHEIYGQIEVPLIISSRLDAEEFCKRLETCTNNPLSSMTEEVHYHMVCAQSKKALDKIRENLEEMGFLIYAK
ncbi:MAG: transcription repressor NadR [Lachnospiraceae bacterium]